MEHKDTASWWTSHQIWGDILWSPHCGIALYSSMDSSPQLMLESKCEASCVSFGVIWHRHFMLWPHIFCLVGKQQTLPFTMQGCRHLPFAGRQTWEKKEHIATMWHIWNILLKVWLLLSATDLRIKIFVYSGLAVRVRFCLIAEIW